MHSGELPIRVPAGSFLPGPIGTLLRQLEPQLQRFFLPDSLRRSLSRASERQSGAYAEALLLDLQINYKMPPGDAKHIPSSGATVMVANHPFGLLEGLILMHCLPRIRSDFRIVANSLLSSVAQLRERFIFVNPFSGRDAHQNAAGVRECYEWIKSGGLLVIFPAGEVAHLNWGEHFVADPKWNDTAARFARKVNCPTVPLFSAARTVSHSR